MITSKPTSWSAPREVIALAVREYLPYGLSYRDVEKLLAERGIEVDHVNVYDKTALVVFTDGLETASR